MIQAEGFENASVAKVAKQAGVHPSLIIHYFGSKEAMVKKLVDRVLKVYGALFLELPQGGDPRERLERMLSLIWSRRWHEAASFSVVFSFLALSQRDDDVMERVKNLYSQYRRYLEVELQAFEEAGVIRVADLHGAAEALVTLSEGSHYFSQYHVDENAFDCHCQTMISAAKAILGVDANEMRQQP